MREISEKCNGCGASVVFEPERVALFCKHCTSTAPIEMPIAPKNPLAHIETRTAPQWQGTINFECSSCGGQGVLTSGEMSQSCAFCGSSHVKEQKQDAGQQPDAVVPFRVGKERAIDMLKKLVRKKFFAPTKFKKHIQPKEMDGLYKPVFSFDAQTVSRYNGVISRTVTVSTGRGTTTRIERRPISGTFSSNFVDLIITACNSVPQKEMDRVQPYNTAGARSFNRAYLFGFTAGQYKRDGIASWQAARQQMDARIRRGIAGQFPGWSIETLNVQTAYNNPSYRYMLLPVYIGHLKHKERPFNFYINGETGRVTGKTPISAGKVIGAVVVPVLLGLAAVIVPVALWFAGII